MRRRHFPIVNIATVAHVLPSEAITEERDETPQTSTADKPEPEQKESRQVRRARERRMRKDSSQ